MWSQCDEEPGAAALSIRAVARRAKVDPAVARRAMTQGIFPVRDVSAAKRLKKAIGALARKHSNPAIAVPEKSKDGQLHAVQLAKQGAKENPVDAANVDGGTATTTKKEFLNMLIQKHHITPAARTAFGLSPDTFHAPVSREEVYLGGDMRVIYEHMLAKARYGGLLAVIGESGSGKSTLKDLLVTDLAAEGEFIAIEPHTQRMEETDKAGKTLKGADIVEAILSEIAPGQRLKRSAEAQLKQVAACLAESLAADRNRRHLLIIEEAHCLPKPTLRHLKRFLEMKNPAVKGLQRPMLSIVLLGQPELADRLSPYDQSVREVWQRCEVVRLAPLGNALGGYVKHRLGNAAECVLPEAVNELARLLTSREGQSFAYPLAVDNWLAVVLSASAGLGKTITAEHVRVAHDEKIKALRGARK